MQSEDPFPFAHCCCIGLALDFKMVIKFYHACCWTHKFHFFSYATGFSLISLLPMCYWLLSYVVGDIIAHTVVLFIKTCLTPLQWKLIWRWRIRSASETTSSATCVKGKWELSFLAFLVYRSVVSLHFLSWCYIPFDKKLWGSILDCVVLTSLEKHYHE